MPGTYYNDNDPKAAAWLRELIRRGLLPDGDVDERSIADVDPADLAGFRAWHWFAGIGGWGYALRLAGWDDDRPVWTGSPPCQPFSPAGKRLGRDDPRHLAPAFLRLVGACRPPMLFGEQVAGAAVLGKVAGRARRGVATAPEWAWFDALSDGLEAHGYAVGAADLPSAGFGGAHIRQRLFFGAVRLGDAAGARHEQAGSGQPAEFGRGWRLSGLGCGSGRLADADGGHASEARPLQRGGEHGREPQDGGALRGGCGRPRADADRVGHADCGGSPARRETPEAPRHGRPALADGGADRRPRAPLCGWHDADWLRCRDGKWRPVEPGTFPLADEIPARVVRLRGYGNAIDPEVAAAFIEAFCEAGALTCSD